MSYESEFGFNYIDIAFYVICQNLKNEQDVKFSYDKLACKEAVDSV